MNWLFYVALAILAATLRELTQKRALQEEHTLEYLVIRAGFLFLISLGLLPWLDLALPWQGYVLSFFVAALASVGVLMRNKALKHADISTVQPLSNLLPFFVALIALLFLGERLSLLQTGGILLIVTGTYLLELDHVDELLEPFRRVYESRYLRLTVFATIVLAVTTTLDRFVLTNYMEFLEYFFLTWNFMGLFFIILHGYRYRFANLSSVFTSHWSKILLPSVFTVLLMLPLYKALSLAYAGLVAAVYRLKSLTTTIQGGLYFHEAALVRKSIACTVMIAGAALVIL